MKTFSPTITRGFSIIEVLVYIAVLVLIAGAVVTTYLSLDIVLLRNQTERELTGAAEITLERMLRDIREAESVNMGVSTLGSSPGVLAVQSAATATRFYLSGNSIAVDVNGVPRGPLTPDSVSVQNLMFRRYQNAGTEMVRIALTLSATNKAASTTRTYYTSAVLRGSYE